MKMTPYNAKIKITKSNIRLSGITSRLLVGFAANYSFVDVRHFLPHYIIIFLATSISFEGGAIG